MNLLPFRHYLTKNLTWKWMKLISASFSSISSDPTDFFYSESSSRLGVSPNRNTFPVDWRWIQIPGRVFQVVVPANEGIQKRRRKKNKGRNSVSGKYTTFYPFFLTGWKKVGKMSKFIVSLFRDCRLGFFFFVKAVPRSGKMERWEREWEIVKKKTSKFNVFFLILLFAPKNQLHPSESNLSWVEPRFQAKKP